MFSYELIIILILVATLWYWQDGMRAKEIARHAGKKACDQDQVAFLDDSVVLVKVRLQRNAHGSMALFRAYHFEFTSDGSCRYQGEIQMLGKTVVNLNLEVHRVPPGF